MAKKLTELQEASNVNNGDFFDISQDQGDTTYISKKVAFANLHASIIESDPLSLHLDQISPQTVSNGAPIFDSIEFSQTPTNTDSIARMMWNTDDETVEVKLNDHVALQVGQETLIKVVNKTGTNIDNGKAVCINGSQGNRATIELANAASSLSVCIGLTTQDIHDNDEGFVTVRGLVRGVDTDSFTEGDYLYVSNVAGELTNIEPNEPHHSDRVGVVTVKGNNGTILVQVNPHKSLTELSDVDGTPLTTNGQVLAWNNDNSYFDFDYNINDYALIGSNVSSFVNNVGYLTAEADTLDTVLARGNTTSRNIELKADNSKLYLGASNDASVTFTGTQLQLQSDLVTSTDSMLLRGGTNGILFNLGSTQYASLTATGLLTIGGVATTDGLAVTGKIAQIAIAGTSGTTGTTGSATTIACGNAGNSSAGSGVTGGATTYTLGNGGNATGGGMVLNGGNAGDFTINPGAGGSATDTGVMMFSAGGNASTFKILFASGGAGVSSGTKTTYGGVGSCFAWTGGAGGSSITANTATNNGGVGGNSTFLSGIGGTATSGGINNGGAGGVLDFNTSRGGDATSVLGTSATAGATGNILFTIAQTSASATGGGTNVGGAAGNITFLGATGGAAVSGTSNTGGAGSTITFTSGLGGTGSTANGANGNILFKSGTTEIARFDNTAGSVGYFRLTSDNQKIQLGTAQDAMITFTGTQMQVQSDVVTSTDSLLLRGGTNGILFNLGATQYASLTATGLLTISGVATTDGIAVTGKIVQTAVTGAAGSIGSINTFIAGAGGASSIASGGIGGTISLTTGAGGAGTGFAGGAGGALTLDVGVGGAGTPNSGSPSGGGAAGSITFNSRSGGNGTNAGAGLSSGGAATTFIFGGTTGSTGGEAISNGTNSATGGNGGIFGPTGSTFGTGGVARTATTATNTGGQGFRIVMSTAIGGAASNGAINQGGAGGLISLNLGNGGAATSTVGKTATGGNTGIISIGNAGSIPTGGAATGGGTNVGGSGGIIQLIGSNGGNASGGTSNTGGNGSDITLNAGLGGTGATANGVNGNIIFKSGTTEIARFDNTAGAVGNFRLASDGQKIQLGAAQDASINFTGTNLSIQSDVVTPTDALLLRGGTNGIKLYNGTNLNASLTNTELTVNNVVTSAITATSINLVAFNDEPIFFEDESVLL